MHKTVPQLITTAIVIAALAGVLTTPARADLDVRTQVDELFAYLRGKRVGMLTNPTGVNERLQMLADEMYADPTITLVCFFAPEHGLRGDQQAGEAVHDYVDAVTGLPVYSLYGERIAPTDEQLAQIDVLVYYIQDVGARFYTYIWTMSYAMQACARNDKKFVVFDRPNPLNGVTVEGCPNTVDGGLVGRLFPDHAFGLPTRYGTTVGELALMLNGYFMPAPRLRTDSLVIVKMLGYDRTQYYDEIQPALQWVLPSPNMPSVSTALVYVGNGIFEGTDVSEGRGTTKPFEIVGAEYATDTLALAGALNDLALPGVRFRPLYFIPTFSKFVNKQCGGVQVHVLNRTQFSAVRTGAHLLRTFIKLYPGKAHATKGIDRLFGVANFSAMISNTSLPVDDIFAACDDNLAAYVAVREKYLLYGTRDANGVHSAILL